VVSGREDPRGVGVEKDAAEEEEEELGEGGDGEHRAGLLRAVARWVVGVGVGERQPTRLADARPRGWMTRAASPPVGMEWKRPAGVGASETRDGPCDPRGHAVMDRGA
jgi:hypothetical protein